MRYPTMATQLARQQQRLNLPWNEDFKLKNAPQIDFAERTPLPECVLSSAQRRQMHVLRARVCKVNPDGFIEIELIDKKPDVQKDIHNAYCADLVQVGEIIDVLYRQTGRFSQTRILGITRKEFLPDMED